MEEKQGHDLNLRLRAGHWQALPRHCQQSGETLSAVVRKALTDYLDLEHQTLWQLSTSPAVVEGVFGGALQVKDLIDHGDFGLAPLNNSMAKRFFSMASVGRRGPMAA